MHPVGWAGKAADRYMQKGEDEPIQPLRRCSLQKNRMEGILSNFYFPVLLSSLPKAQDFLALGLCEMPVFIH